MFRTELILRAGPRPHEWRLELPVVWETEAEIIVIPPGFITDLASIPRIFQALVPVNGKHRRPAVLHDYLYVMQGRSRAAADRLFLDAMASVGTPWVQRHMMYRAVRLGGGVAWGRGSRAATLDRDAWLEFNGLRLSRLAPRPGGISPPTRPPAQSTPRHQ